MGKSPILALAGASLLGIALGACASGNTGDGGSGGGGGSVTVGGTGGSTPLACMPGETRSCYDGAPETRMVGACHDGIQTCAADGSVFGACTSEGLPAPETCDPGKVDEDCDGKVNEEGANCVCGDTFVSAGEGCDDGNLAPNDGCDPKCNVEAVIQVAQGGGHVCALIYDGRLKCWGQNNYGQVGVEDAVAHGDAPNEMGQSLPIVKLGSGRTAIAVSLGLVHTCALLDDHSVKCWGWSTSGQLGQGDPFLRGDFPGQMGDALLPIKLGTGRTAKAIGTGQNHSCAVLDDDTLKCWGGNDKGQLGRGTIVNIGTGATDMGDNLAPVPLGQGKKVLSVAGGATHTCAILVGGDVKCWGSNASGELGLGNITQRGDGTGAMGDQLPVVDLGAGKKAKQLALGASHSCALLEGGSVKCWGDNSYGNLGLGDTQNRGDNAGEMGDALPAVDLGAGRTAVSISAAGWVTCAVLDDQSLKCWGNGGAGQLGQGNTATIGDAPGELGGALAPIDLGMSVTAVGVANSSVAVCAVTISGRLKCWGGNAAGGLGLGDTMTRGNMMGQMGDALPFPRLLSGLW